MNFIDKEIENYCIKKSSGPSSLCEEIQNYTFDNEHWSVMLTGKLEASILGFFLRITDAKRVLEFGTYTGYSALAMAENLPEDGEVVTLERDPRIQNIAKGFWERSPHGTKIKPLRGEGLELLDKIEGLFDFIFIDADKINYQKYLDFSLQKLNPRGMIAIDNTLWSGKVISDNQEESTIAIRKLNDGLAKREDLYCSLLPIRDGIFLIQKKEDLL